MTETSESDVDKKLLELNAKPPTSPVPGEIVVSPYFKNGAARVSDHTLRHEIAHACSSVKRQLAAMKGDNASGISLAVQQRRDSTCDLNPKAVAAYANLLTDVRENQAVSQCLYKVAAESIIPASYGYVAKSCPGAKLEEGFAIARALIQAPRPLYPATFPNRECRSQPSRLHPAAASVSDCMVRHSSEIRNQLKEELKCR